MKKEMKKWIRRATRVSLRRSHILVHQAKRLCSPNLVVTHHEAQLFPNPLVRDSSSAPGARAHKGKTKNELLVDSDSQSEYFDRILADVPCSGDGTIRKAADILKKWTPKNGINLHKLQILILLRGAQLLKVGGTIVYSTCSLNPLENEAVVAEVLRWGGSGRTGASDLCCAARIELN